MPDLYSPPTMPLYWDRLIADTADLTPEELGAYIRLMYRQWTKGCIPASIDKQARIAGVSVKQMRVITESLGPRLQAHPTIEDSVYSPFMERVRAEMQHRNSKSAAAGSKGGKSKWGAAERESLNRENRSERLRAARALGTHTPEEWALLLHLCGNFCLRCGKRPPEVEIVKDHVHILAHGGSDAIDNLQPLCRSCNSAKGPDRTDFVPPEIRQRFRPNMGAGTPSEVASETPSEVASETPGERLANALVPISNLQSPIVANATSSQAPRAAKLPLVDESTLAARAILSAVWPKVAESVAGVMTKTEWGKRNMRYARDLVAAGATVEAILAAYASASRRLGCPVQMLSLVQSELASRKAKPSPYAGLRVVGQDA